MAALPTVAPAAMPAEVPGELLALLQESVEPPCRDPGAVRSEKSVVKLRDDSGRAVGQRKTAASKTLVSVDDPRDGVYATVVARKHRMSFTGFEGSVGAL